MREFRGNALGDIDGFAIEDVVSDEPALGEIRINVEAIALGFVDQLVIRGQYQVKPDLPFTPGGEIVGTVDKLGGGVCALRWANVSPLGNLAADWLTKFSSRRRGPFTFRTSSNP